MKKQKKKDVSRLLELLGTPDGELAPPPKVERTKRERGPCGKMMFPSEKQAKQAATNRLKKGSNVNKLRTHWCSECKAYHLTSSFFKKTS